MSENAKKLELEVDELVTVRVLGGNENGSGCSSSSSSSSSSSNN